MQKINLSTLLCGCALLCLTTGCQPENYPKVAEAGVNRENTNVTAASAIIRPTQGSFVKGNVTFTQSGDEVKIVADIDGLKPGKHGFHIHEYGDCSAPDGSSAGAHFNPDTKPHADPDNEQRHVGDLGNIEADEKGHAHYERTDKVIQLNGPHSIVGKSVIVHAAEDDFKTQPTGNAGARLGCGLIEAN